MNLGIAQVSLRKLKVHLASSIMHSIKLISIFLKEAERSYKMAIKHRQKYPDAYYNLGNLVSNTYTVLTHACNIELLVQRYGASHGSCSVI